jgi:hypothetical protein
MLLSAAIVPASSPRMAQQTPGAASEGGFETAEQTTQAPSANGSSKNKKKFAPAPGLRFIADIASPSFSMMVLLIDSPYVRCRAFWRAFGRIAACAHLLEDARTKSRGWALPGPWVGGRESRAAGSSQPRLRSQRHDAVFRGKLGPRFDSRLAMTCIRRLGVPASRRKPGAGGRPQLDERHFEAIGMNAVRDPARAPGKRPSATGCTSNTSVSGESDLFERSKACHDERTAAAR